MLRLLQLFLWSCLFTCLIPSGVQAVSPISLCTPTGCEADGDKGVLSSDLQPLCFKVGGVSFRLLPVQGGKFRMGAENNDFKANNDEKPVHTVRVSDFYLGETEVTQALWGAVMGENHSYFEGENHPVEQVSWDECMLFLERLSEQTGYDFRLPTETEWEYAARGGQLSCGHRYAGGPEAQTVAWYSASAQFETQSVAQLQPNELGLYDMSGNVAEWCSDWYGYYRRNLPDNPQGAAAGSKRVCRGGSWEQLAIGCRVTARHAFYPSFQSPQVGLRLALSATQNQTKRISPRRRVHKTATEGNAQAR